MDDVPHRESAMTAYEMMLSESQERMLMVLKPGREDFAAAIFHRWEPDFAVIGTVTDTGRMVLEHKGEIVCDKLGRASWRERVCQYVSLSVVDVTLKTTRHIQQFYQYPNNIRKPLYTLYTDIKSIL